mmetsp:Transcript_35791/g.106825  ORF Transcript_35791/g.106825 Transcript_35791/m.106825 type:complete len:227 (-) Transcript_35791:105-785(-)
MLLTAHIQGFWPPWPLLHSVSKLKLAQLSKLSISISTAKSHISWRRSPFSSSVSSSRWPPFFLPPPPSLSPARAPPFFLPPPPTVSPSRSPPLFLPPPPRRKRRPPWPWRSPRPWPCLPRRGLPPGGDAVVSCKMRRMPLGSGRLSQHWHSSGLLRRFMGCAATATVMNETSATCSFMLNSSLCNCSNHNVTEGFLCLGFRLICDTGISQTNLSSIFLSNWIADIP